MKVCATRLVGWDIRGAAERECGGARAGRTIEVKGTGDG